MTLRLVDDGHLHLLNSTGTYLNNLTQGGYPRKDRVYLMSNDANGILRLYSYNLIQNDNWSVLWSSNIDKCDPIRTCGLNGFSVTKDQDFDCSCLLGFAFVDQNKRTPGCERNFTTESCRDRSMGYYIVAVPNTTWENVNFSTLLLPTQEDCKTACLTDYNCEAVLFKNWECKKQRLPLRFGRRIQSETNLALIKVGISQTTSKKEPTNKKELRAWF